MKYDNIDELMRVILAFLPQATIGEDNDGQIIVYTNLTQTDGGKVSELS